MLGGQKAAFVAVFALMACVGLVSAGYPVRSKPFPNLPGTAHVDQFTPNNVDRVEVVDFTVVNFGAAVLDFQSLTAGQRIELNLGGGVRFDSDQITFGGSDNDGPVNFSSELNDINLLALKDVLFQSRNDFNLNTDGGDLNVATESGNIRVSAGAEASFSGSSVLIDGRHSDGGVNFDANADITIGSGNAEGTNGQTGLTARRIYGAAGDVTMTSTSSNLAFDSANNINLNGGSFNTVSQQGLSFEANAAGAYVAGNDVTLSSFGAFNFVAPNGIQAVAIAGTGTLTASNGNMIVTSERRADLVSINGGLTVRARNGNIDANAGQSINIDVAGNLIVDSSQNIITSSTLVSDFSSDGDLAFNGRTVDLLSDGNANIHSALTLSATAKTSLLVTSTGSDTSIKSGDTIDFESTAGDITTGAVNLIMTHDVSAQYAGRSVSSTPNALVIDSGEDLTFTTGRDFINTAAGNFFLESDYSAKLAVGRNIAVTTILSDIRFTSGANSLFSSSTGTTFDVGSDFSAIVSDFIRTNVTGAHSITSRASSVSYTFSDTFSSFATAASVFTSPSFNALIRELQVNATDINLSAKTSITLSAQEVLQLSTDIAAVNVKRNALINANGGVVGDFNGDTTFSGKTVSVTSQGTNIDARDDATLGTRGGNDITVKSDNLVNVHARFNGDIVSQSQFTAKATDDINVLANDDFGGEWKAIAAKSLSIQGGALIDSTADRHEFYSARDTNINFSTLSIGIVTEDDVSQTLIDDERNENLFASSGKQTFRTSLFNVQSNFGTTSLIGNNAVSIESTASSLTIATAPNTGTTADDIRFVALDDITFTAAANTTLTSDDIYNTAINTAIFEGKDVVINGDSLVSFRSSLLTRLIVDDTTTITSDTFTEQAAGAHLSFDTETIQVNAGNAFMTSNGGGIAFHATSDITFTSKADWRLDAVNDVTYNSASGNIASVSTGQTSFVGGYLDWTTFLGSMTFSSLGGISVSSSSDEPIQFVASKDFVSSFSTIFSANAANNITIATKGLPVADMCLTATDATSKQSYIGASGVYSSSFTNSTFLANQDIIISASSGSVGITSNGNQTDPFNDIPFIYNQRFGVLFRTTDETNGLISFTASSAGADFYGRDRVDSIAEQKWTLKSTTESLFVVKDHFGNATVRARDGQLTSESGSIRIIGGTSNTDGPVHFNSTGSAFSQAGSNINILQEGTRRDSNVPAISIHGTQGGIDFQAVTSITIDTSIADGNAFFKTVNGDLAITAGQTASFNANSGIVDIEGQTGVSFDASAIFSTAVGGTSTFNTAPGVGDVVINSDSIAVTASLGEINFSTFQDATITASNAFTIASRCASLYGGGSVEIVAASSSTYSTNIDTSFKSLLETTIEAQTSVTFEATNGGVINIHTGGDQLRSGFTASTVGDLSIFSAGSFNASAVTTAMQFQDNFDVTADSVRILALGGNAGSGDNIVFQAVKGDFVFDSTGKVEFTSVLATLFKTEGPSEFNVVLDPFTESKLFINSGGSVEEDSSSVNVNVVSLFQVFGRTVDWNAQDDIRLTATEGYFYVTSEDYTTVTAPDGITIRDQTTTVEFYTDAANSDIDVNANGISSTISFVADQTILFQSTNIESRVAELSSYQSLTTDINVQSTRVNVTGYGVFTATAGSDIFFLNNPADHYGIYFGAGLESPLSGVFDMSSNVFISNSAAGAFNVRSTSTSLDVGTDLTIDSATKNTFDALRRIDLVAGTTTSVSGTNGVSFGIFGNANNLDANNQIQTTLLDVTVTGDTTINTVTFTATSESDLTVSNTGFDMTFTAVDDMNVKTNGNLGTIFDSDADILLGLNPAASQVYNALSSIFMLSGSIAFDAATSLTLKTTSPDADILNAASGDLLFDVTDQINILTAIQDVPSEEKNGEITFTANDIDIGVIAFVAEGNRLVSFNAFGDITVDASTSINVESGLEILFNSNSFITSDPGSTLDIVTNGAFSDIEFKAASLVDVQGNIGNFVTANPSFDASGAFLMTTTSYTFSPTSTATFTSESGEIVFDSPNQPASAPIINWSVNGPNGLFEMTGSTSLTVATANGFLNVNSGRNINLINHVNIDYTTMTIESRNNVLFQSAGSLSFSFPSIEIRTENVAGGVSGDITMYTEDDLLVNSNDQTIVRARANLGNTGARISSPNINRNYNEFAIEIQTLNGPISITATDDVFIISHQGDIEYRSQNHVRYSVNDNSLLSFFSQAPAYRQANIPSTADYCAGGCNGSAGCFPTFGGQVTCIVGCTVECDELSEVINDIIDALDDYGLTR